ncbi:MAG: ABC transporter permease, partial [Paracoccus sp. (in: a-proteobacteria)]
MLYFIIRRILLLIPVVIGLTIIMFAIARLLPGDPVGLAAGPNATQAEIEALAAEFGLDQPIWTQYFSYV